MIQAPGSIMPHVAASTSLVDSDGITVPLTGPSRSTAIGILALDVPFPQGFGVPSLRGFGAPPRYLMAISTILLS